MSEKLHPLDQLCIASRVRYTTNFTAMMTLNYCRDIEHLCQELYWTAKNYLHETGPLPDDSFVWWFTIEITDNPTVVPLRLKMQIPSDVFREEARIVVPCFVRTLRKVYDGYYGPDKVHMGGAPLMSWEDLL